MERFFDQNCEVTLFSQIGSEPVMGHVEVARQQPSYARRPVAGSFVGQQTALVGGLSKLATGDDEAVAQGVELGG